MPSVAAILGLLLLAIPAHGQLCGDADGDGQIGLTDGVLILNAAAGLATPCTLEACDADGNGTITLSDGVAVLRAAAELPAPLACPHSTPDERGCADVGGRWHVFEELDVTCSVAGEEESASAEGEGIVDVRQDGCAISFWVPDLDAVRTGTVDGHRVTITGPFAFGPLDGLELSTNEATASGVVDGDRLVLEGHGRAEGTVQGYRFRCTGSSIAVMTRMGDSAAAAFEADEHTLDGFVTDASALFGGLVERFTIVAPQ